MFICSASPHILTFYTSKRLVNKALCGFVWKLQSKQWGLLRPHSLVIEIIIGMNNNEQPCRIDCFLLVLQTLVVLTSNTNNGWPGLVFSSGVSRVIVLIDLFDMK